MIMIWVPKRLVEVSLYNVASRSPEQLTQTCEEAYHARLAYAARKVKESGTHIVMLTGPSASGKTTSAHKLAETLTTSGTPAQVISLDNFFRGASNYPLLPDGSRDYESPEALDLPLINQCLDELYRTGETELPVYDFIHECRASETEHVKLAGGVCIVEGIHALNPELTRLIPAESVYRVYAGLREEYCAMGRRCISTRDIRLCRRILRDAATRGHSPEKTLAMWDGVLDGENRYIKTFKNNADFLLDTSFSYELGIIAGLLRKTGQMLSPDSRYLEVMDETARRFEEVTPLNVQLIPADSMLREFYE